jgi:hypothetical protein
MLITPTHYEKIWKPFKRQEDFLTLPDSIKEGLYGGAAMGGKSEVLLMLPIVRGFYKHPKFKGILFRRTYPELEREIIVRSLEWYKHIPGAKYSDEKKRWTFREGGIMQFGHLEYESDARKYDTAEYNYMAFDELTSFTEFQYLYLAMSRCRTPANLLDVLPPIVRSGTNPGNVGHGWVRKRFIEPAPYETIIVDRATGLKRIFIQSKVQDNPHADPNYLNQLSLLPEAERRAKRDGDWWVFSGQVFDDWREEHMSDEPENARHVIKPFNIPDWWPRILALDWGYSAMTCAIWGALSPDLRLYIYREKTWTKTKISTWATELGKLCENEEIKAFILCRSAWQTRGEDKLIADQVAYYSGMHPKEADNDRVAGKLLMQEYIRWKPKPVRRDPKDGSTYNPETAGRILRNQGTDAYKSYLASFIPEKTETNIPRLQVFENCQELRKAIPLCVYDEKNPEDVAEFKGDDPYDTIRYLIKEADKQIFDSTEAEKRALVSKIVDDLKNTGNQTTYYQQMSRIEKSTRKINRVRRFGNARVA